MSTDELGWRFDEETPRRDLVRVAIASAKARAILMADALDMDLCGIKSVADRAGASQDVRHEQSRPSSTRSRWRRWPSPGRRARSV